MAKRVWPGVASLYKGVVGAASGAGIYIGTYFAFYGTACNLLSTHSNMSPGGIAFVAGGIAAAGGSVVKVPLAVCIRSVQVGSYLPSATCPSYVRHCRPPCCFIGIHGRHSLPHIVKPLYTRVHEHGPAEAVPPRDRLLWCAA